MANKRRLKKAIRIACGNMAGECIITRNFVPGVDAKKIDEIIFNIADLQFVTLENVSFSFDKSRSSFESPADIDEIVKQMNDALPAEQKERNKAAASK